MVFQMAARLRARIAGEDLLVGVGARDALEARLIERAGFDFIWSSSFCVSASYAVPDTSLLSMSQYLEAARSICEAVEIPVVADCDTGYGNASNVIHAVKRFEEAGVAAICMEDQTFPKESSLLAGGRQKLASPAEFAGKVRAAAECRRNEDLVIIARVEALIAGWGMEEALERAGRYAEAGADCILIHSRSKTPDEVLEFIERFAAPVPLVLVPTNYPSLTEAEIGRLSKVGLVIYANQPLRAGVQAQQKLLTQIKRAGGIHTIDDDMASVSDIFDLQGVPQLKENEKQYLPREE